MMAGFVEAFEENRRRKKRLEVSEQSERKSKKSKKHGSWYDSPPAQVLKEAGIDPGEHEGVGLEDADRIVRARKEARGVEFHRRRKPKGTTYGQIRGLLRNPGDPKPRWE